MEHTSWRTAAAATAALTVAVLSTTAAGDARGAEGPPQTLERQTDRQALATLDEGRRIFRFDTFGDQAFWGDTLRLHEAIRDVSPAAALSLGLKVDSGALPPD